MQKGTSRNSCLVPYTLQPFEALTPEAKPLKGLGHRDEPFIMERRGRQSHWEVETQVESRRKRDGKTPKVWRAKAEPQPCVAKV